MSGKMAILVDGGFFRVRAKRLLGFSRHEASECAEILRKYCKALVDDGINSGLSLYRIFFYDCPPAIGKVIHPLTKDVIDLSKTPTFKKLDEFFSIVAKEPHFAFRRGKLGIANGRFAMKPKVQDAILRGTRTIESLTDRDIHLDIGQKGVDMRLGLDLVMLALKRLVERVVIITGDSDFIPAIKMARREGVSVICDSMGSHIADELCEHLDGMITVKNFRAVDSV